MKTLTLALLLCLAVSSCANGLGAQKKTTQLRQGMTKAEVIELLGQPGSTELINGHEVWKYSLQKMFVGWVPNYLTFEPAGGTLIGWHQDMQEYQQQQSLWIQSMPQQHNVHVDGDVNHHVDGTIRIQN